MTTINHSKTPGCVYHTAIGQKRVSCTVDLPRELGLDEAKYIKMEKDIHDAMEAVLAPFFKGVDGFIMCGDEVVAQITGPVTFTPEPAKRGWGFPSNSKRAHYFTSERSLCMKWMFFGHLEDKNHEHSENCKECMRKRAKL